MDSNLLQLPLFSDSDRAFVRDLDSRARAQRWADPDQDDVLALRSALTTLAGWGTLKHAVAQPTA